jgi:hypothetical protein
MAKRHRSESGSPDATTHSLAWFSALLRGIDRNDQTLVEQARRRLEELRRSTIR